MSKILIVDDEQRIRDLIKQYLEFDKHITKEAVNGQMALDMVLSEEFDLVLLDVMMPVMDGITAMRLIREKSDIPIILLTAKNEEYDRILGFDLGADDYISKPFSPRELLVRIKAILKRVDKGDKISQQNVIYQYKGIELNISSYILKIDGVPQDLTPKEIELLTYFIKNKNNVLKREAILQDLWGYNYMSDTRTVDTHVKMLRNSLGVYRDLIKTIWGVGYRYDEN